MKKTTKQQQIQATCLGFAVTMIIGTVVGILSVLGSLDAMLAGELTRLLVIAGGSYALYRQV